MSDDRLRRALRELGHELDPDPDEALRTMLPGGRRRRTMRRIATGAMGTLAVVAVAFASPAVLRSLRVSTSQTPMPGPAAAGSAANPGTEAAYESCVSFDVGRPSEIEDARSFCGVVPDARRVEGGTAFRMTTTAGETFWVTFSDHLRPNEETLPIVVPGVLISLEGQDVHDAPLLDLTTAEPREAVEHACQLGPCQPTTDDQVLPSGAAMRRWASGTFVTTVDLGRWTAVICCSGTPDVHERIAHAFAWSDTDDLFLTLSSTDPGVIVSEDWASALPWFSTNTGGHRMRILPGCSLGDREPDLGGRATYGSELDFAPGKDDHLEGNARWCADGYLVDVDEVDLGEAREFHAGLRVAADLTGVPIAGPTPSP